MSARAVACKAWRWLPGMATTDGLRVLDVGDDGWLRTAVIIDDDDGRLGSVGLRLALSAEPDLDDPATRGCLLALVREAWGKPGLYASKHGGRWRVKIPGYGGPFCGAVWGDTEADALIAALEAAP